MDDLTDLSRPDLERLVYRSLAERDAARRSARLCRELLTEALNRTRGCPRCNPTEETDDGRAVPDREPPEDSTVP